ncbi:lipase family protein, partial [Vibrio parahaemolyticus V-223/04]
RSIRKASSAL